MIHQSTLPDLHMFEAVMYQLPKSVSFHQATKGKPRQALEQIERMLANLADDVRIVHSLNLSVGGPEDWMDAAVAAVCMDEARNLFGQEDNPDEQLKTWRLGPEWAAKAIAFALSDDRWPRQKAGPINLHMSYCFNWRGFSRDLPEPLASWENGLSSLMLNFHRRSLSVAPSFVFPVPYESAAFEAFFVRLGGAAPFEIKAKHVRRMLVNPKNGAIRYRNLA
jgi:hypothetical protein